MPSPFPGMDPYLEAKHIWPDLHDRLANLMSSDLNRRLPRPYYTRLNMRQEIGIEGDEEIGRRIVPDVVLAKTPQPEGQRGAVAMLAPPMRAVSPSLHLAIPTESIRHLFLEIRDPTDGHKLITLIEIVSPSNKRRGPDRDAYLAKQAEVLASDASLIEIDLHRTGKRLFDYPQFEDVLKKASAPPDYVTLVNRGWQRSGAYSMSYQVFPFTLRDPLPCIPVPLREDEPEVPLDLQFIFDQAYEGGPYQRGAIDYGKPPRLPLRNEDEAWVDERLRTAGYRQ